MLRKNITECQRLFHGRGKFYKDFEHLSIDWYPPVIVITLYKPEEDDHVRLWANALKEQLPECRSIFVQYRFQHKAPSELLWGEALDKTIVSENGLKYHIELGRAQNCGLFLDMYNGRDWLKKHASGKSVLNLFAYTCAFSDAALAGGAKRVINVDNNKGVLKRGRENHLLNELDVRSAVFESVNIFRSFSRIKKYAPYDLIVCDPPSYQVGSVDITRDYKKIVSRVPQWLKPGGELMLCFNSPHYTEQFLLELVAETCPQCAFVEQINPPAVFKESELGRGLKVLIFCYSPQKGG